MENKTIDVMAAQFAIIRFNLTILWFDDIEP